MLPARIRRMTSPTPTGSWRACARSAPRSSREMSALAVRTGAVNLGQGFPDTDGPAGDAGRRGRGAARRAQPVPARPRHPRAARRDRRPPAPVLGPRLRPGRRGAGHRRRDRGDRGQPCSALCEPGDEVVCFEPYYDSYAACIALAGAVRRPVTLRPGAGRPVRLRPGRAAGGVLGPRTRLVLLNSPHNPTGKVFTARRADADRASCARSTTRSRSPTRSTSTWSSPTRPARTSRSPPCPACGERTLRISSAGKTFSCTGWKIGWVSGPRPRWSRPSLRVKQFLTFVNGGAVPARGRPSRWACPTSTSTASAPTCRPSGTCSAAGPDRRPASTCCRPEGTYFVTADITALGGRDGDRVLPAPCRSGAAWSPCPPRSSTTTVEAGRHLIRFAFCKRPEVLDRGRRRRPAEARRPPRWASSGEAVESAGLAARTTSATSSATDSASSAVGGLDHHPDQRLGAGRAQQHPAGLAQRLPRPPVPPPARTRRRPAASRSATAHVDQHLRQLGHHRGQVGQRLRRSPPSGPSGAARSARRRRWWRSAGSTTWPLCSPPRAKPPARSASSTYRSPTAVSTSVMPCAAHRQPQAEVAHHGRDQRVLGQRAGLAHGQRQDRHDLVAVDDVAVGASTARQRSASPSWAMPRSAPCSSDRGAAAARGACEPQPSLMLSPSGSAWITTTSAPACRYAVGRDVGRRRRSRSRRRPSARRAVRRPARPGA